MLRRRAVGRLEHREVVADVAAGRDADAADLGRDRVGQVVAVEVGRGEHVELVGAQQHLLEHDVGDLVLDDDVAAGARVLEGHPRAAVEQLRAVLLAGHVVAPLAERALGELHDVALVDERHGLAVVLDRVVDRLAHQALAAERRDRLDAEAGVLEELGAHLLAQELGELLVLVRTGLVLDAGVHVLGVLAEDHDVDRLGVLERRGHALVVLDRADAGVQVEVLAQRDVERAEAAADRRGQRALDRDHQVLDRGERLVGEVVAAVELLRLLAEVDLAPMDLALAAVGLGDRRVPDAQAGGRDVDADAVTLDVAQDRVVRDDELAVLDGDLGAAGGQLDVLVGHRRHLSP